MVSAGKASGGGLALKAEGLHKTYGHGKSSVRVLKGLDLSLRAGELLVLLGPSGSGKSTLLNLLGLMDRPDSGDVLLAGRPTARLSEEERSKLRNESLGFVFQFDSLLPEFTVWENVTMPARIAAAQGRPDEAVAAAHARAARLLEDLGLKSLKERFPSQVSGGERQRAAICRALVNGPAVVLADEPTGNLDKHNGELVFKDLRRLAEAHGTAVVLVTHNESACASAHRVLHMADGALESKAERV
jgi:lipoprotein-releasing system ATP-binding protein